MQGHAIEECDISKHGDFNHGLVMVDIVQFQRFTQVLLSSSSHRECHPMH